MEISNLDMESRPSCISFHYFGNSENINFIINNNDDENKDDNTIANVDSSNSKDNADNPVILYINTQIFSTRYPASTYRETK